MPTCKVEFENGSKGVFHSGQKMIGTVTFDNEKSRRINVISIMFEGFAKCKWTDHVTKSQKETFRGRESFVDDVRVLLANEAEGKHILLPIGVHKFKFSFDIPENIPSSIEANMEELKKFHGGGTSGLRGFIRYCLVVKVNRSWKFDFRFEFPVTIIKRYDLNFVDPRNRVPVNFTFSSKDFRMSVDISCTAFVGGQKANFFISFLNQLSMEVLQTKIQLVRINRYTSDEPNEKTRIGNEFIKTINVKGVAAKGANHLETDFFIPSVPPSSDKSCKVLKISYEIHVTAVFGGVQSDYTIKIPIVIGTIPFLSRDLLSPQRWNKKGSKTPFVWPLPSSSTASLPTNFGSSQDAQGGPPVYNDAISKSAMIDETAKNEKLASIIGIWFNATKSRD